MSPLAIVTAIGSRGDVNPMLAIARLLKQRQWRILFVTSEPYVPVAQAAGFETHCIISQAEFNRFVSSTNLWRPVSGLRVVLGETASRLLEPTYELLQRRVQHGNTLLVSHPLDFASRIYRDAHPEVPLVGTLLAPMAIRTAQQPSRLTDWPWEIQRPAWAVRASYWVADQWLVARWLDKPINALRRRERLPPVSRVLAHWYLSPDLVLGLFPDWFAADRSYWPKQLECVGFPLEDAGIEMSSQALQSSTDHPDNIPAGSWVFTMGTANVQAAQFYALAAAACDTLQIPGLLLTEHAAQVPPRLPSGVRHQTYVPFRTLLPRCRGMVHHGGIGTTSQALAAGIRQLIVPLAFDQFDNGQRVQQSGCGRTLPRRRLNLKTLIGAIDSINHDPSFDVRCPQIASQIASQNEASHPIAAAVQRIEHLAIDSGIITREDPGNALRTST